MRNIKTMIQNLPILLKDKGLLIIAVVCIAFGIFITLASGKMLMDYTSSEEIKAKIVTMEEYLQKFAEKEK